MKIFGSFRIGRRIVKTAIAAGISMFIVQLLKLEYPSLAVVAAIITLQPTVHETVTTSKNRLSGTIVGSILGVLFSAFLPDSPFILALGIVLLLSICNFFNWQSASSLSCVVFASIVGFPGGGTVEAGIYRVLNTLIGIITSLFINWIIPAVPVDKYTEKSLQRVFSKLLLLLRRSIEQFINGSFDKKELTMLAVQCSSLFEKAQSAIDNFQKECKYVKLDANKLDDYNKIYKVFWNAYIYVVQISNDVTLMQCRDFLNNGLVIRLKNIVILINRIEKVLISRLYNFPSNTFDDIFDNTKSILSVLEENKDELVYEFTFEHISYFLTLITNIQLIFEEFMKLAGDIDEKSSTGIYKSAE